MFIETRPHVLLGCLHNIIITLSCLISDKEGLSLGQKAHDDIGSDLADYSGFQSFRNKTKSRRRDVDWL